MMNRKVIANHNIFGSPCQRSMRRAGALSSARTRSEGGYTLVALLALMTVVALFAMAVAPRVQQEAQREREREAIFRGEQVADAIRQYYIYRAGVLRTFGDQALPTSIEQLLDGIPIPAGSKNRQILRRSAARDPLTIEGEWAFVHPRTQAIVEFQQSIMFYAGNVLPTPRDQQMSQLQQLAVPQIVNVLNLGASRQSSSSSATGDDAGGPFVGVTSRSKNESVLTYYGIERHDQWIFTPLFR